MVIGVREPSTEDLATLPRAAPFLDSLRREALDLFLTLPVPSAGTEAWRHTNLADFDFSFAPFTPGGDAEDLNRGQLLNAVDAMGERAGVMIQRNSQVISTQTATSLTGRGVVFCDLMEAAIKYPELVEPHLHALVPTSRSKFTALHGAFCAGGTFLYLPRGVVVELPFQSLTYLDVEGAAVFPHTLIVAEEDSEATLIGRYASPDLGWGFSDAVVEIVAGPAARVRYVSIQEWGEGVTHLEVQRATLDRDSEVRTLAVGFGGSLARTEAETVLEGEGASSETLGLFFADGRQHFDYRAEQDHTAPRTTSDLLHKGALRDESRAVFSGWVHVRPGAQKTDAMQTSRNILLSDRAKADAVPNLEIETNDVRCGHAASVGPVEDDTLFYLMSRGISRKEAERLIVLGFFQEVLDRIGLAEVRDGVAAALETELG